MARVRKDQAARRGTGTRPIVAIVGRPNVGKSALFNRLTSSKLAIVEDIPGVTRDRLYADGFAFGRDYIVVDTGGFDPDSDDPMTQNIAGQVGTALEEADAVICLLDGSMEPTPADREAVRLLREADKPVLFAANKIDNPTRTAQAAELYTLGMDTLMHISALHGHGIGDLEEELITLLPEAVDEEVETDLQFPRIAIIGRPNAGKSSLVNRLLGESRQIVDDRPGTTVDSVDSFYEGAHGPMILIDTAGIRRKRAVESGVEALSVMQAIRAVERSHVVVLMIDAHHGVTEQDTKIAGLAVDRGRALVLALNKMDLLDGEGKKQSKADARDTFNSMQWAPRMSISVETGRGVSSLMEKVAAVAVAHKFRVTTGELNRFFEEILGRQPPPTQGGRAVKLKYVTQAHTGPPTFVASCNYPDHVHFSYKRFVVNQLRERFGFEGTPIRVHYRAKKKK